MDYRDVTSLKVPLFSLGFTSYFKSFNSIQITEEFQEFHKNKYIQIDTTPSST